MGTPLTRRETCRLCDGRRLELAVPMAATPIADAYVPKERLNEPQALYPLDLYLCLGCGHVQNLDVIDPELLFRDYLFVTSSSPSLVEHFRNYASQVVDRFEPGQNALVVEIGSNDGSLLRFFKDKGLRILGVDPARSIAQQATSIGLTTLDQFFTSSLAESILGQHGPASLVVANNVFAHADDLADIVRGIRVLLGDDGVFIFEVSYLVDIVERFLFDTIYHEHVSYHSIIPLTAFFEKLGMELFDVERIPSKGGSIRGFAQRRPEGHRPVEPVVEELRVLERERGLLDTAVFRDHARAIAQRKTALSALLDEAHSSGKRVAGYGASTTVTTLMWQLELASRLEFVVDDNPRKQGLFTPRTHLPVFSPEEIYRRHPALIVVLAWQYADPIIARHGRFLSEGGQFVIPLPDLRVVGGPAQTV